MFLYNIFLDYQIIYNLHKTLYTYCTYKAIYIQIIQRLAGLANENQALRQNTVQVFLTLRSVFNTSNALSNDHVMIVNVFIVRDCCRKSNIISVFWAVRVQYILIKKRNF